MSFPVRLAILSLLSAAAVGQQPKVFLVDPAALVAQKTHPDSEFKKLVVAAADSAMKKPVFAITDKTFVPPSGDRHDYTSLSRYFWPNPATPNHLPYIRKDGQSNPEIESILDHEYVVRIGEYTRALALGYYLTGNEAYAEHATLLLRHFFLDPATAMNPNMEYAQFVPGVSEGRGSGVLDTRWFAFVVDAIGMLHASKSWTDTDQQGMTAWFGKYYDWLRKSDNGKHEAAAPNNHGSWYAVQAAAVASFLGKTDDLRAMAQFVHDKRIPSQFDKEGLQKYELVRTNSYSYSAFNLEALTELAQIVSSTGIDLYQPQPGLVAGLDALLPYDKDHKWPHDQIDPNLIQTSICPALNRISAHFPNPKYDEAKKRYGCPVTEYTMLDALSGKH